MDDPEPSRRDGPYRLLADPSRRAVRAQLVATADETAVADTITGDAATVVAERELLSPGVGAGR